MIPEIELEHAVVLNKNQIYMIYIYVCSESKNKHLFDKTNQDEVI